MTNVEKELRLENIKLREHVRKLSEQKDAVLRVINSPENNDHEICRAILHALSEVISNESF